MLKIENVVTALFTPMFLDGRIDFEGMGMLAKYNAIHGAGLLSAGTTSESPTIYDEQGKIDRFIRLAADRANPKVPLVIGAGSYDTARSEELTQRAKENGADATLHVMGYYNKPSQKGVMDYFERVAHIAPRIPIIMYHIPGRGGAEYLPETIAALAKMHPNINCLKEASASQLDIGRKVRKLTDENKISFSIMSGDDDKTYQMITADDIKANGVISVMSNILPHMYVKLVNLSLQGSAEAQTFNEVLDPINKLVSLKVSDRINGVEIADTYRNPQPVKTAAYILGMTSELGFRSPMVQIPQEGVRMIGNALWKVHEATSGEAFMPLQEFFKPNPCVSDRLMKYSD